MAVSRSVPAWRFSLFVLTVAAITWLGAVNIRAMIAGDLLKPGTFEFDQYLAPEAEREIFRLLSVASTVTIAGYVVTLISSIVFLATSPWKLRQHGWLMMSAVLFYLFLPVEMYTMVLDARMVYLEFFTTAENAIFRELFIARAGALAGAPAVAHLCYYTILGLIVFQPLKKPPANAA